MRWKFFPWCPFNFQDNTPSEERYKTLRRNTIILIVVVSMIPHFIMSAVDYREHKKIFTEKHVRPLYSLLNKTKNTLELFLAERLSTVNFIASAYSYKELYKKRKLQDIFRVMTKEFGEFIDIGMIDSKGAQISYAGPYDLKGKDYSKSRCFLEAMLGSSCISDVFTGYRDYPHFAMAVQRWDDNGKPWILRSAIGMEKFKEIVNSTKIEDVDVFLINREGLLQTPSEMYGEILNMQIPVPPVSYETSLINFEDYLKQKNVLAYTYLAKSPFILVAVKPQIKVFKSWLVLRRTFFLYFFASITAISLIAYALTNMMIGELKSCDVSREEAVKELEHSHKLSLIGRMSTGIAHEINNPMAIINEKAGLMKDMIDLNPDFPDRERFNSLLSSIAQSVKRCSGITHRFLGFSRRMEMKIEELDINEVLREVLGFLEKEALNRNIRTQLKMIADLRRIASDRGKLQQVFLNIINNAFDAVEKDGTVTITSWQADNDTVAVSVQDNGRGIPEEELKHIFDPFFTTKGSGTGLGLSITFGIVRKFGGNISVESKLGEGTTFTVYLPVAPNKELGS